MAKKSSKKASKRKVNSKKGSTPKAEDLRIYVRNLMLDAITEQKLPLNQLSSLATTVLSGAAESLKKALPSSRTAALRQVISGIDEAWAVIAHASATSLHHANRYGLKFAQRDLTTLAKRLGALEEEFIQTVTECAHRLGGEYGEEVKNITKQIQKAGTQIRPAVHTARKVIAEHGGELAREMLTVGTKVGKKVYMIPSLQPVVSLRE